MCLFKVAHNACVLRLVFFFRKSTEKRQRERERETRGGKDATQTHVQKNIIQPFFLSILKP